MCFSKWRDAINVLFFDGLAYAYLIGVWIRTMQIFATTSFDFRHPKRDAPTVAGA